MRLGYEMFIPTSRVMMTAGLGGCTSLFKLQDIEKMELTHPRFHCLFCHGYEEKNVASAGVLAVGDMANPFGALHLARMAKRLTPNVTLYTNGADDLAQKTREAAKDDDMKVVSRTIKRLEKTAEGAGVVMHFENGEKITEGFLVSFSLDDTDILSFSRSRLT